MIVARFFSRWCPRLQWLLPLASIGSHWLYQNLQPCCNKLGQLEVSSRALLDRLMDALISGIPLDSSNLTSTFLRLPRLSHYLFLSFNSFSLIIFLFILKKFTNPLCLKPLQSRIYFPDHFPVSSSATPLLLLLFYFPLVILVFYFL